MSTCGFYDQRGNWIPQGQLDPRPAPVRAVLAMMPDRYELGAPIVREFFNLAGQPLVEHRAQVVDRATGEVVLVCSPPGAREWLAWWRGEPGEYVNNDMRVCACRHLCGMHGSTFPDYSQAPGVGNGLCGFEGCGCEGFSGVVERPAVWVD